MWKDRHRFLYGDDKPSTQNDNFFAPYRGCVLSVRNSPGVDQLKDQLDLSLEPLHKDWNERDNGIFPERAFFSTKSALPLGFYLRR